MDLVERIAALERAVFGQARPAPAGVRDEAAGPIRTEGVTLDTGYRAAWDARMTTDVGSGGAPVPGGAAAMYVQHRASGVATRNTVVSGIRGAMVAEQSRLGQVINDACWSYGAVLNIGADVGAFGYHIDAYHVGRGADSTTYGSGVELYRGTREGTTVGYHVRSLAKAGLVNDYGYLVSRSESIGEYYGARLRRAFAAGAREFTGELQCDIGLDLEAATCDDVAIRVRAGRPVRLSGVDAAADLVFDPRTGYVELRCYGRPILQVQMTTGEILSKGRQIASPVLP